MDFTLDAEQKEIRDWVRTFVRKEIIPLEPEVLRRERAGQPGLPKDELKALQDKAKQAGFFGVLTPQEYGGMGLGATIALGFVAANLALNYGFERRSITLWVINAVYAVVGLGIAGAIIGGWKRRGQ